MLKREVFDLFQPDIAKDLFLSVKAGSTGRPNKPSELANMERAMPWIIQLPGVNPTPLIEKYCHLLDVDVEEMVIEGMPSIQAMNALMAKAATMMGQAGAEGQKPGKNPSDQGGKGENNAPAPAGNEPQSQPAYPTQQAGPGMGTGII